MASKESSPPSYSQFACIGTGFSAIGLGATLQRWYGITDIRFFERNSKLGGTWQANQYPGCACDVPSVLYSLSFAPNPNWSRVLSSWQEIWDYLDHVARQYSLQPKMTFEVDVVRCEWIEDKKRWRMHIRDNKTKKIFIHECQFLFAGSGNFVKPRELGVPGAETFKGEIFHSSRWRHDVPLEGKRVVVIGNGCTAAQIVPNIVKKTKHLTQIIRSAHWVYPAVDNARSKAMQWICKYVPGTMAFERFIIFLFTERELQGFYMTKSAAKFRQYRREKVEKYMREKTPAKYHDMIIPDFEVGCKRRIFDSGYLDSLNAENLTVTKARTEEIVPEGIRTPDGIIEADVIVLANGFVTNQPVTNIDIIGRHGTITEHWAQFGGAEAYNCSVLSGFPNFFMLLGPNAATGHTSAIIASENSINYAMRVIKPILEGKASALDLKHDSEERYVAQIQRDLTKTVWNSGCSSWYIKKDPEKGTVWNAMSYPYSQSYFWYRSLFPTWSDWEFFGPKTAATKRTSAFSVVLKLLGLLGAVFSIVVTYHHYRNWL